MLKALKRMGWTLGVASVVLSAPVWAQESASTAPQEVCKHMMTVVLAKAKPKPTPERLQEATTRCVNDMSAEEERLGKEKFDKVRACVLKQTVPAGLDTCDPKVLFGETTPPPPADADVKEVCAHAMKIFMKGVPNIPAGAQDGCLLEIGKAKREIGPEKFAAFKKCALAATTVDALSACEPK